MISETAAFLFFAAIALAGAVNVVTRRNPVHAALWLVGAFLGVAGLFLTMGHGLLGAIQVMVYAGAIMVLFLFVILLLNLETPAFEGLSVARGASLLVTLATLGLIVWPLAHDRSLNAVPVADGPALPPTAGNVASALFNHWAMPFEGVSLLLLVAMVGGIHLARRHHPGEAV